MPKVFHVKKARKDNTAVKKGEPYYHWQRYRARKQYSATYPKRSQLTSSGKLATIYDAEDAVGAVVMDTSEEALAGSLEALKDTLDSAGESFREVGEEYNESADNLEEYFSGSSQIDDIREKAEACEEAGDNCETLVDNCQELIDRLEELGDKPTPEAKPTRADAEAEIGEPDADDEVEYQEALDEAHDELVEAWESNNEDEEGVWQTEFDDIASDADNTVSEFAGPQF